MNEFLVCSFSSKQIRLNKEFPNNSRQFFANFAKKIISNEWVFCLQCQPIWWDEKKFTDNYGQIITNFAKQLVMNEFLVCSFLSNQMIPNKEFPNNNRQFFANIDKKIGYEWVCCLLG